MKKQRLAVAMLALTASFACSANSEAAEGDATHAHHAASQPVENTLSVATTYEQIRTDVAKAEFSGAVMLGRIDHLVSRIDSLVNRSTENNTELTNLRNATLQMRAEVVTFIKGDGTSLVQVMAPMPAASSICTSCSGQLSGEFGSPVPMDQGSFVGGGSFSSGGSFSGGAGGGGGGGGMLSGRSFLMLGGIGGAIAAATSDDDDAGPVASATSP